MIQRKQTVYLILALLCAVVCLCMPLAGADVNGASAATISNFGFDGDDVPNIAWTWSLGAVLVLSCVINVCTIVKFNNRRLQSRLCVLNIMLMVVWYLILALHHFVLQGDGSVMHIRFASVLPFITIVLYVMARNGIMADERLVRSADRIR